MKRLLFILVNFMLLSPVSVLANVTVSDVEKEIIEFELNNIYYQIIEIDEQFSDDNITLDFVAYGDFTEPTFPDYYGVFWLVELTNNTDDAVSYAEMLNNRIQFYYEDHTNIYPYAMTYTPINLLDDFSFDYNDIPDIESSLLKAGMTSALLFYAQWENKPHIERHWIDIDGDAEIEGYY